MYALYMLKLCGLRDMEKYVPYSGKVWWVESLVNLASAIRQAKTIQSGTVVTINNPLTYLFICQMFFHQTLEKSKFAKQFPCQLSHYMVRIS